MESPLFRNPDIANRPIPIKQVAKIFIHPSLANDRAIRLNPAKWKILEIAVLKFFCFIPINKIEVDLIADKMIINRYAFRDMGPLDFLTICILIV